MNCEIIHNIEYIDAYVWGIDSGCNVNIFTMSIIFGRAILGVILTFKSEV
jgi:hypothetical protein